MFILEEGSSHLPVGCDDLGRQLVLQRIQHGLIVDELKLSNDIALSEKSPYPIEQKVILTACAWSRVIIRRAYSVSTSDRERGGVRGELPGCWSCSVGGWNFS